MIRLTRIVPDLNMSRYYQLHLQPGLFGDCDLVREWGRIGSSGTIRTSPYPTQAAATAALAEAVTQRHKRGYRTIAPRCSRDYQRVQAAGRQACAPVRQLSELDRPAWTCNVEAHCCDGFRMPALHGRRHAHRWAGVRKPPGKEGGVGHLDQRVLWGIG